MGSLGGGEGGEGRADEVRRGVERGGQMREWILSTTKICFKSLSAYICKFVLR